MKKLDAMSIGALAFAAFAAYAYLKPKTPVAVSTAPASGLVYDTFSSQANQAALIQGGTWQNLDYLKSPTYVQTPGKLFGALPTYSMDFSDYY